MLTSRLPPIRSIYTWLTQTKKHILQSCRWQRVLKGNRFAVNNISSSVNFERSLADNLYRDAPITTMQTRSRWCAFRLRKSQKTKKKTPLSYRFDTRIFWLPTKQNIQNTINYLSVHSRWSAMLFDYIYGLQSASKSLIVLCIYLHSDEFANGSIFYKSVWIKIKKYSREKCPNRKKLASVQPLFQHHLLLLPILLFRFFPFYAVCLIGFDVLWVAAGPVTSFSMLNFHRRESGGGGSPFGFIIFYWTFMLHILDFFFGCESAFMSQTECNGIIKYKIIISNRVVLLLPYYR